MISAAEAIDAVAGRDGNGAVATLAGHAQADADAPVVEAAVVQPAQLAMRPLQRRKIGGGKPLPREEDDALEAGDVDALGHRYPPNFPNTFNNHGRIFKRSRIGSQPPALSSPTQATVHSLFSAFAAPVTPGSMPSPGSTYP